MALVFAVVSDQRAVHPSTDAGASSDRPELIRMLRDPNAWG